MSEEETAGKLKVVDKRRFTEEGEEKSEGGAFETKATKSGQPVESANRNEVTSDRSSKAMESKTVKQESMGAGGEAPQVDFSSFIISLATQVLVMLGEVPHPETNQTSTNFEAAKQTIDILSLLQEKTKGNLNENEDKLMQEVITSLRLAYVNKKGL